MDPSRSAFQGVDVCNEYKPGLKNVTNESGAKPKFSFQTLLLTARKTY